MEFPLVSNTTSYFGKYDVSLLISSIANCADFIISIPDVEFKSRNAPVEEKCNVSIIDTLNDIEPFYLITQK